MGALREGGTLLAEVKRRTMSKKRSVWLRVFLFFWSGFVYTIAFFANLFRLPGVDAKRIKKVLIKK